MVDERALFVGLHSNKRGRQPPTSGVLKKKKGSVLVIKKELIANR